MTHRSRLAAAPVLAALLLAAGITPSYGADDAHARNVILLIGDGMGYSEITIARNYHLGAAGRLNLDKLPFTGSLTTYSVEESDPRVPVYVTDSAASASGWATGHKTSLGRLSTVPGSAGLAPYPTILELAQAAGLRTGDVSTAELTDATPAALAAHVNSRRCQGPADMGPCPAYRKSAGGPGSVAEQLVDHHVDVLLGGGQRRFSQVVDDRPYAGQTVMASAVAQGYRVVTDAAGLAATSAGQRVLGLFAGGNLSLEWSGERARAYPGSGPQTCTENQRPAREPSLADMTAKAIELLDREAGPGQDKGFLLQVEGASIDKRDHASDPCGQIGETVAFDKAVGVALDFARRHPDTLVIVTADHANTSQIIEPVRPGQKDHPGAYSVLVTADGAPMTVGYATEPVGSSQSHTGTQLRIAATGPQAARVLGVSDQTELFHIIARALGLE